MQYRAIFLYANSSRSFSQETAGKVFERLKKENLRVFCEPWLAERLPGAESRELSDMGTALDALIVVGGDGTLLRAAPDAVKNGVPMLGIHTGTVGFLMESTHETMDAALSRLLSGNYALEERSMLQCRMSGLENSLALNDIAITRGENPGLLNIRIHADGEHIYDLSGDGVLVSTPTGCTAYSLSAGGPIVRPNTPVMTIIPLCARQLLARPVVLPADASITLEVAVSGPAHPIISLDGQKVCVIQQTRALKICRAAKCVRFIRFEEQSFFEHLRIKSAMWNQF